MRLLDLPGADPWIICKTAMSREVRQDEVTSGKCGKNFNPHDLSGSSHGIITPYILAVILERRVRLLIIF